MKKVIGLLLLVSVLFVLTGCDYPEYQKISFKITDEENVEISIVQAVEKADLSVLYLGNDKAIDSFIYYVETDNKTAIKNQFPDVLDETAFDDENWAKVKEEVSVLKAKEKKIGDIVYYAEESTGTVSYERLSGNDLFKIIKNEKGNYVFTYCAEASSHIMVSSLRDAFYLDLLDDTSLINQKYGITSISKEDKEVGARHFDYIITIEFPADVKKVVQLAGLSSEYIAIDGNKVTMNLADMPYYPYDVKYIFEGVTDLTNYVPSKDTQSFAIPKGTLVGFDDVTAKHWAYDYIRLAVNKGLFTGTKEPNAKGIGHFAPEKAITKAEFITTLVRNNFSTYSIPAKEDGEVWYAPYYKKAIQAGYLNEEDFTLEEMNNVITREEMAYILSNVIKRSGKTGIRIEDYVDENYTPVSTNKIPDWYSIQDKYKDGVQMVYTYGIISGTTTEGHFSPKASLTRAQAATILVRYLAWKAN